MSVPLVSVCMITYNHEKFIAEAIEGVLMQEVDFEVELIIADDCSSDNTGLIIQGYVDNHPKGNWINYIRHSENKGMMGNFVWALKECKGKYVALCEGDDYWIDPYKLQKQVEFLDANLEFVLSYHDMKILKPGGELVGDYISVKSYWKSIANIYDLAIFGNFIHTPSVVFRNVIKSFPSQFEKAPIGDYFLYLLLAEKGLLMKLPDCMAVYRLSSGYFSSQSFKKRWQSIRLTYQLISQATNNRSVSIILKLRIYQNKIYKVPFPDNFLRDQSVATMKKIIFNYLSYKNIFYACVKFMFEKLFGRSLSRKYFRRRSFQSRILK